MRENRRGPALRRVGLGRPEASMMNQETTDQSRGQPRLVLLKNLYLDPNNEFRSNPPWRRRGDA